MCLKSLNLMFGRSAFLKSDLNCLCRLAWLIGWPFDGLSTPAAGSRNRNSERTAWFSDARNTRWQPLMVAASSTCPCREDCTYIKAWLTAAQVICHECTQEEREEVTERAAERVC